MANVINNDNFTEVIAQSHQAASQPQQNAGEQLMSLPPQKPTETTVVIKIGNQEMGRAVIKAIESVPGYNLRGLPRGA
jgi:ABC-type phosphate transport system auxiliary subunit